MTAFELGGDMAKLRLIFCALVVAAGLLVSTPTAQAKLPEDPVEWVLGHFCQGHWGVSC